MLKHVAYLRSNFVILYNNTPTASLINIVVKHQAVKTLLGHRLDPPKPQELPSRLTAAQRQVE